jgi:glycine cleavage system regulatory protein
MSSFFSSELVREEMDNITKLQEEIYENVFTFSSMSREDKLEHVEKLSTLLDKQRVLYTRLSLSDDPEAKRMKSQIFEVAVTMGFPKDVDITYVFSNMTKVLDEMKKAIIDNP